MVPCLPENWSILLAANSDCELYNPRFSVVSCIKHMFSKSLNGQLPGAFAQEYEHIASERNTGDGHLATCPKGVPQTGPNCVTFLEKVAYISCKMRLAGTCLRNTEYVLYTGHYTSIPW